MSTPRNTGRGPVAFTLIELLTVIAIVAVLAAILFPVFTQTRDKARQTACLTNGKQVGLSYVLYMQDNDGRLPLTNHQGGLASWIQACQPYIKGRGIYRCPSDTTTRTWARTEAEWTDKTIPVRRSSYFLNAWLSGANRFGADGAIDRPANVIYVAESREENGGDHFHPMCWGEIDPQYPTCSQSASLWDDIRNETKELALRRHQGGATYFYLDGHARWRTWGQVWWQDRARNVFEGEFDPRQ
jgi:prepilin-type N-terminal cleavage/methylation domain-containing protein/prepilin-type processing-associated H-X9-DG protein